MAKPRIVRKFWDVPAAKYYVTMTDERWSRPAKKHKVVVMCDSMREARAVEKAAKNIERYSHVRIAKTPPRYGKDEYNVEFWRYQSWMNRFGKAANKDPLGRVMSKVREGKKLNKHDREILSAAIDATKKAKSERKR